MESFSSFFLSVDPLVIVFVSILNRREIVSDDNVGVDVLDDLLFFGFWDGESMDNVMFSFSRCGGDSASRSTLEEDSPALTLRCW